MKQLKMFWSRYSANIVRFWTNQLVMSILGISISLATIALDNFIVSVIGCVFSIGFLCFLQYDNTFQLGEKDHFRPADIERPKRTLGFKISLFASVPMFFLILIGIILQISLQDETATTVCKFIYYALHGSYIQLHVFLTSFEILTADSLAMQCVGWGFYLLYTVPAIFFSALGYFLGAIDRPLQTFIGLKHPNRRKAGK